jgi:peroxisomal membrane protein 4
VILNPRYADYLAVLKAARNGAVYGAKVRFPHALVYVTSPSFPPTSQPIYLTFFFFWIFDSITFLFRSGTIRDKLGIIYRATRTHARNLATYATIYKLTMLLLKNVNLQGGKPKEGPFDTFFAGLLGGYMVFGRRSRNGNISSISKQIVVFSKPRSVSRPQFVKFFKSMALILN